jgi:HrpA-like RNA helicase
MSRVSLEQLSLSIKLLKMGTVPDVLERALTPPDPKAVTACLEQLTAMDALWEEPGQGLELTPLGRNLARLPVDAATGKTIIFGAIFGVTDAILTIAAGMSVQSPFVAPFAKRAEANEAKIDFAEEHGTSDSDHLTILKVYQEWQRQRKNGDGAARQWSRRNFVSESTLRQMVDIKRQFAQLLSDIGLIDTKVRLSQFRSFRNGNDGVLALTGAHANRNTELMAVVKAVLCAGIFPNIIKAVPHEYSKSGPELQTRSGPVHIHPQSLLFKGNKNALNDKFLLFHDKMMTKKIYVRAATIVSAYPLLLFGSPVSEARADPRTSTVVVTVDGWITLNLKSEQDGRLLRAFRETLTSVMKAKVDFPERPLDEKHTKVLEVLVELLKDEAEGGTVTRQAANDDYL